MRRHQLLAVCVVGLVAASASAQPRVGPTAGATAPRPAVSPYLQLLRPGNSPGVNYYGLVRPQVDFRNSIQDLQQQITTNQTDIAGLNTQLLPVTGHRTTFMNTGGYFGTGGLGAATGGRPAGAARPTPQLPQAPQPPRPARR
jgi:hypothetical protein